MANSRNLFDEVREEFEACRDQPNELCQPKLSAPGKGRIRQTGSMEASTLPVPRFGIGREAAVPTYGDGSTRRPMEATPPLA